MKKIVKIAIVSMIALTFGVVSFTSTQTADACNKCTITEYEYKCKCGSSMSYELVQDEKGNYLYTRYTCKDKKCNHTTTRK